MYNFSEIFKRFNTHSLKWDVEADELPMWVADMDFKVAPEIILAMQKCLDHGIFGYNTIPLEFYKSIQDWWQQYHNFFIQKEWIIFSNGVMPAISSIIRTLTKENDQIVVQSPVYHAFFRCIQDNERIACENLLSYCKYEYSIDFDDLEKKLANPKTTLMILCNPHNPIGKIWNEHELNTIATLCKKYNVFIVSDEIHCDIIEFGHSYIPFASIMPESISTLSANKTFNLAGLQGSICVIPDEILRKKIQKSFIRDEISTPNTLSIDATIAAFNNARPWLDALNKYISSNKAFATEFIQNNTPLQVINGQATYLLWIDCSEITHDSHQFCIFLRQQTGLYVSSGKAFGGNGYRFFRLNVACPHNILKEGLQRLKNGVNLFLQQK